MNALAVVDTLASAFAFGGLTWFFFVQTMVLVKRLGRARFVPLQLGLVRPLFGSVSVASLVALGVSVFGGGSHEQVVSAGAALVTASFILFVVAPRAMRAGGESLRESMEGEAAQSAVRFTADGGGEATRVWHRVLGLLTVVLGGALGVHLALPVVGAAKAPAHHHAEKEKWKANRETTDGVHAMQALVKRAQAHELTPADAATMLRAEWSGIFQRCTMTGAAHEALHGFLLPIDAQLKALATAERSDEVLQELAEHLAAYDGAFE